MTTVRSIVLLVLLTFICVRTVISTPPSVSPLHPVQSRCLSSPNGSLSLFHHHEGQSLYPLCCPSFKRSVTPPLEIWTHVPSSNPPLKPTFKPRQMSGLISLNLGFRSEISSSKVRTKKDWNSTVCFQKHKCRSLHTHTRNIKWYQI